MVKYLTTLILMLFCEFAFSKASLEFWAGTRDTRYDFKDSESSILLKSNNNPTLHISFKHFTSRRFGYSLEVYGSNISFKSDTDIGLAKFQETFLTYSGSFFLNFRNFIIDLGYRSGDALFFTSTTTEIFANKESESDLSLSVYLKGKIAGGKFLLGIQKGVSGSLSTATEGDVDLSSTQYHFNILWGKKSYWGLKANYIARDLDTNLEHSSREFNFYLGKIFLFK